MFRRPQNSKLLNIPSSSATPKTADVVIIGAGIIGCSVALELARNKDFTSAFPNNSPRIVLVDKNDAVGQGTTSWSSGIIRTTYSVKQSVRLSLECAKIWVNWRDYLELPSSTKLCNLRQTQLWFCKSKKTDVFFDKFKHAAEEYNITLHDLDMKETQKIADRNRWDISKCFNPRSLEDDDFGEPDPNNQIVGSVSVPETYHVSDPGQAVVDVAASCLSHGRERMMNFVLGKSVVKINRTRNDSLSATSANKSGVTVSSVTLSNGDVIETPRVINCAGPYSQKVEQLAFPDEGSCTTNQGPIVKSDATVSSRPLRVEGNILETPPGLDKETEIITFDLEAGFYQKPDAGTSRMVVGGLELNEDPLDWVDHDKIGDTEAGGADAIPGDQAMLWLYRYALRVPSTKIPSSRNQIKGFVSTYDVSDDWSPICDASNLGGYYALRATSGNCFKTAPLLSQMLSKIIVETENGRDTHETGSYIDLPLGGEAGNKLRLDTYSRKRKVFNILGGVIG